MRLALTRFISATLIAVFAALASAAALCVVPCELTPSLAGAEATAAEEHHCYETSAPSQGGPAMNGVAESCADHHAWEAPAVHRAVSRAPVSGLGAHAITSVAVQLREAQVSLRGMTVRPPASPPLTFAPLRI